MELIRELIDHRDSQAFLEGTTATPVHRKTNIFELFDKQVFRMYLDSIDEYLNGSIDRTIDIEEILDQLSTAIRSGELVEPIFTYIDPYKMLPDGDSLFVKVQGTNSDRAKNKSNNLLSRRYFEGEGGGAGSRYVINPRHYGLVTAEIMPYLLRNEFGLITARDTDEVDAITEFLNRQFEQMLAERKIRPDQMRRFQALHSNMPLSAKKRIRKEAREQKFNFLVTRFMGDEALNFPQFSAYIDLNRSTGPRQLLQRIGRVMRLYPLKTKADVVSFMLINESSVAENLKAIHRINKGDLNRTNSIRSGENMPIPKEIRMEDGRIIPVENFSDRDRIAFNQELESQLQSFWMKKEDLASKLDNFIVLYDKLPSTNAFDNDEKSLAAKIRQFLRRDFHSEFWNLLSTKTQKKVENSELDFRPIKDVRSELKHLADDLEDAGETELNWLHTSRTLRLRDAIQRAYRKGPHFIDQLADSDPEYQLFLRKLCISALPEVEQVRLKLLDFWALTYSLPDLFASSPHEAMLAASLRKLSLKNGRLNFLKSLPLEIQEAINNSKHDFISSRPIFERLQNYLTVQFSNRELNDASDIYNYRWDFSEASKTFRDFIRKTYHDDPSVVERLKDQGKASHPERAEMHLFISALREEDRAALRLNYLAEQNHDQLPRANLSTSDKDIFEEARAILKKNTRWVEKFSPELIGDIQTHPELVKTLNSNVDVEAPSASTDVSWPIASESNEEFFKRFAAYMLGKDVNGQKIPDHDYLPPAYAGSRSAKAQDKDFDLLDLQLILRMNKLQTRLEDSTIRSHLLKIVAATGDQQRASHVRYLLDRGTDFMTRTRNKDWSFYGVIRQAKKFREAHGRLPTTITDPALFNSLIATLNRYPPLIDYFPDDIQQEIRKTDFWRSIVSRLKVSH